MEQLAGEGECRALTGSEEGEEAGWTGQAAVSHHTAEDIHTTPPPHLSIAYHTTVEHTTDTNSLSNHSHEFRY